MIRCAGRSSVISDPVFPARLNDSNPHQTRKDYPKAAPLYSSPHYRVCAWATQAPLDEQWLAQDDSSEHYPRVSHLQMMMRPVTAVMSQSHQLSRLPDCDVREEEGGMGEAEDGTGGGKGGTIYA